MPADRLAFLAARELLWRIHVAASSSRKVEMVDVALGGRTSSIRSLMWSSVRVARSDIQESSPKGSALRITLSTIGIRRGLFLAR